MVTKDKAAAFRALHYRPQPFVLPNAWDYASAAALSSAGFPAIGTTSLGVAAGHGLPDGEGQGRAETIQLARRIGRLDCLITVDVEGGFSADPAEVADLTEELASAGVVGINLEDGRANHALVDAKAQEDLIRATKTRVPDLFVNARTDTYWLADHGEPRLTETLRRIRRYEAAGADGIFVPGLVDEAEITSVVEAVDLPLNLLYLPDRTRPHRLGELGVRRISTGSLLFRAALRTVLDTASAVHAGAAIPNDPPSYAGIQRLIMASQRPL